MLNLDIVGADDVLLLCFDQFVIFLSFGENLDLY